MIVAADAPFEEIGFYDSNSLKTQHETLVDCQKECLDTTACVGVVFDQDSEQDKCYVVLPSHEMQYKPKKRFYRLAGFQFCSRAT